MVCLIFVDKQIENFLLSSLELLCIDCVCETRRGADAVLCDFPSLEKVTRFYSEDGNEVRTAVFSRDKSERRKCPHGVKFMLYPVGVSALSSLLLDGFDAARDKSALPEYDGERFTVTLGRNSACLTEREGKLFELLWNRRGECISRDEICETVWEKSADTNVCDVYISYLRRKLKPVLGDGAIRAVRGVGYILDL